MTEWFDRQQQSTERSSLFETTNTPSSTFVYYFFTDLSKLPSFAQL